MSINSEIAQQIVDELQTVTDRNINFMNNKGSIIASLDRNRIGDIHEGALEVLKTQKKGVIRDSDVFMRSKPGVNFPVFINNQIVGVIGITGPEEEVEQIGDIIKKMTEILVKQAYLEKQLELEYQAKESFINEWINGNWEDEKIFVSRGWILGIDVQIPRIAVVIDLSNFHEKIYEQFTYNKTNRKKEFEVQQLRNEIIKEIQNYLKPDNQDVVFPVSNSRYVILVRINNDEVISKQGKQIFINTERIILMIKKQFNFEAKAGIGRYHQSIKGISISNYEAERAVFYTKKQEHKHIQFFDNLGLESFVEEISFQTRKDFVERILQIDKFTDKKQMIQTLQTFFQCNQSIKEASEKLIIHKNTLQYRLKKVKELTGYDPRDFSDALLLYLALFFYINYDK